MTTSPDVGLASDAEPDGPWERYGWLMGAVWLVFLVFPIIELLQSKAPLAWVAIAWVALVLFAGLFIAGLTVGMRAGWGATRPIVPVLFFALLVCQLATVPVLGWAALGFLPFVMSYASYGMRGWWHWVVWAISAVLAAVGAIVQWPTSGSIVIFGIVIVLGVVNTVNTWLIGRSVRAEQLRVDLATSHERETLARDVHDLIGHSLTVVKLKAELAARLVERDPERARAELAEIAALAGEAISGVRSTVTGLRASGLAEQLEASRSALELAGLTVRIEGDAAALSPAQSLTAAWILREATTNVLRHASAASVVVAIEPGTLRVSDDGTGLHGPPGNGMRGMAERASAAGAALAVEVGVDGGTVVSVRW